MSKAISDITLNTINFGALIMEKVPAVVCPLDEHMGLDIARSLGKNNIQVYGIDPNPNVIGKWSKYCELVLSPDPKKNQTEFIKFMITWAQNNRFKPVLYPLSDDMVLLFSKERETLGKDFEYVMPKHELLNSLLTKEGLISAAISCDVPVPITWTPKNIEEVKSMISEIRFPVILKPIESSYWHTERIRKLLRDSIISGQTKVKLCQDVQELIDSYANISQHDSRMIIQEVITGPVTNGAYVTFYLDRHSNPLGIFTGRKMRVLPMGFGSSCFVHSCHNPDVEQLAMKLLSGVGYQGLGGLEFKLDDRDGLYKVIEFNTRYGMWDGLGIRCGINNPYIAYYDALRLPVSPQRDYREGVIWVDWQRDVRAFWMLWKRNMLSFVDWLRSFRGEKMWAIYSKDDWRPGVAFTVHIFQEFFRRVLRRIKDTLQA
jgi:predicted ATP-grasp superfamily ATP-dependent carboligase